MHLGHARTFWTAQERARASNGVLILRNDDLDRARVRPEFVAGFMKDLRWFGLSWSEGPDLGGPFAPYNQSERLHLYRAAFERLAERGFLFPCTCSRQDVLRALNAPHQGEDEPVYPGACRQRRLEQIPPGAKVSWRFRVPEGEAIQFLDGHFGPQRRVAGEDFGDFVVWRHDDLPSYQLACVVDDAAMQISEVVRGADLILSTFRQLLLYRALGHEAPSFCHCPLMTDANGQRLAKRNAALSLRELRARGMTPAQVRSLALGHSFEAPSLS